MRLFTALKKHWEKKSIAITKTQTKATVPINTFSWINKKIQLRESTIEGTGYFAVQPILKDEKLIVQSGQCVHVSAIDTQAMESCWYTGFQIENDIYYYPIYIDGKPHLDGIFRINHSCTPNAGFRGQITLVAMRDIEPGEEITFDYMMTDVETDMEDPWSPEICNCNTEHCRKKITGHDWKLLHLQEKYKGYLSTHVANSISNMHKNGKL